MLNSVVYMQSLIILSVTERHTRVHNKRYCNFQGQPLHQSVCFQIQKDDHIKEYSLLFWSMILKYLLGVSRIVHEKTEIGV